jgi:hypothetical protein
MNRPTWEQRVTGGEFDGQYTAGKLHYTVEGNAVLVTKDIGRGIESIALYTYNSNEKADKAAYNFAVWQANK